MIAKLILNEIKKGEHSALGSIGIGSITFTNGYKSIKDKFSYWNPMERAIPYGDNIRNLILIGMGKWAYGCLAQNILVVEDINTPMGIDNWIDNITKNSKFEKRYLKTKFDGKRYVLYQKYFKDLNIGEVIVKYEKNGEVTTDTYYLMRYK